MAPRVGDLREGIRSLKLTFCTWKWMIGRWSFPFGMAYFQGRTVSFKEGTRWEMRQLVMNGCMDTLVDLRKKWCFFDIDFFVFSPIWYYIGRLQLRGGFCGILPDSIKLSCSLAATPSLKLTLYHIYLRKSFKSFNNLIVTSWHLPFPVYIICIYNVLYNHIFININTHRHIYIYNIQPIFVFISSFSISNSPKKIIPTKKSRFHPIPLSLCSKVVPFTILQRPQLAEVPSCPGLGPAPAAPVMSTAERLVGRRDDVGGNLGVSKNAGTPKWMV